MHHTITLKASIVTETHFVVYGLYDKVGTLQFIGQCRFTELLQLSAARSNILFEKVFPPHSDIIIRPMHYFGAKHDAHNYIWRWLRENPCPFMMRNGLRTTRQRPVRCVDTGDVFMSLSEAASAYDVTLTFMSNHMLRKPGSDTVRGKRFEWVETKFPNDRNPELICNSQYAIHYE